LRRQDHTTSPSARLRPRQQRNLRPSHPRPTFVTIAKRPSVVGRDGCRYKTDLGPMGSKISDFPKLFIAAARSGIAM
jgi:hypothetical protein